MMLERLSEGREIIFLPQTTTKTLLCFVKIRTLTVTMLGTSEEKCVTTSVFGIYLYIVLISISIRKCT